MFFWLPDQIKEKFEVQSRMNPKSVSQKTNLIRIFLQVNVVFVTKSNVKAKATNS